MVVAILNNYRQSPRKVRVVADTVRGKGVEEAIATLTFMAKRSSLPIKKLVESAIANAEKNYQLDRKNLYVKEIMVNAGVVMKRSMPAARGSAHPIKKRTSTVKVVLAERAAKLEKPKAIKAPAKKAAKASTK